MITRKKYLEAISIIHEYKRQCLNDINTINGLDLTERVCELEISVRLQNAISKISGKHYSELTVMDLSKISRIKFLKQRNVGRKTYIELRDLLAKYNLHLSQ